MVGCQTVKRAVVIISAMVEFRRVESSSLSRLILDELDKELACAGDESIGIMVFLQLRGLVASGGSNSQLVEAFEHRIVNTNISDIGAT